MQGAQNIAMLQTNAMGLGKGQGEAQKVDPSMFGGIMNMLLGVTATSGEGLKIPEEMIESLETIKTMLMDAGIEFEDQDTDKIKDMPIFPQMLNLIKQQGIEVDSLVKNAEEAPMNKQEHPVLSGDNIVIQTLSSEKVPMELLQKIEEVLLAKVSPFDKKPESDLSMGSVEKSNNAQREAIVNNIKHLLLAGKSYKETDAKESASAPPVSISPVDREKTDSVKSSPQAKGNEKVLNVKKDEGLNSETIFSNIKVDGERQIHPFKQAAPVGELSQKNVENIEANVIRFIETANDGDTSKMIVKLTPESLGELNLDLSVRDGKLTAKIFVENNQIREIVDAKLAELTGNLQKHNINVDKIQVQVTQQAETQSMDMGSHESFRGHQNRRQWQRQDEKMLNPNRQYQEIAPVARQSDVSGISILA